MTIYTKTHLREFDFWAGAKDRANNLSYVIVFKLSRFGRNAKDILNLLTYIQRFGVNLICKEDGLDSSTSMGKIMITILGAVAEMERENIIAKTMLGREENSKKSYAVCKNNISWTKGVY